MRVSLWRGYIGVSLRVFGQRDGGGKLFPTPTGVNLKLKEWAAFYNVDFLVSVNANIEMIESYDSSLPEVLGAIGHPEKPYN